MQLTHLNSAKKRCADPQVGAPLSSGQTLSSVANDLGLSPQCLRDWRKSMESEVNPAAPTSVTNGNASHVNDLALAREIGQLRRELEAMTRQRGILPSAVSIFSEDKGLNGGSK